MGRALRRNNRLARRPGTSRATRDQCPECCEGGCAMWWIAVLCAPVACGGPAEAQIAVCESTTCANGDPLQLGRVVMYQNRCYRIDFPLRPTAQLPPGIVKWELPTILCLPSCTHEDCTNPNLVVSVQSCANGPVSYYCTVTGGPGGCYVARPPGGGCSVVRSGVTFPGGGSPSPNLTWPPGTQFYQSCCQCYNQPGECLLTIPDRVVCGVPSGATQCCCGTVTAGTTYTWFFHSFRRITDPGSGNYSIAERTETGTGSCQPGTTFVTNIVDYQAIFAADGTPFFEQTDNSQTFQPMPEGMCACPPRLFRGAICAGCGDPNYTGSGVATVTCDITEEVCTHSGIGFDDVMQVTARGVVSNRQPPPVPCAGGCSPMARAGGGPLMPPTIGELGLFL